jgi:hypothetical protein
MSNLLFVITVRRQIKVRGLPPFHFVTTLNEFGDDNDLIESLAFPTSPREINFGKVLTYEDERGRCNDITRVFWFDCSRNAPILFVLVLLVTLHIIATLLLWHKLLLRPVELTLIEVSALVIALVCESSSLVDREFSIALAN